MSVLVLAADLDPTVDAVIAELNRRQVSVFRADLAWFPQRLSFHARLGQGAALAPGWSGVLHAAYADGGHRHINLEDVRSVWYRAPTAFQLPDGLSGPEQRHAMWEAKLGYGGVLADLPVLWVNHPGADADAAYKPVQLATAARCGLAVPPTLITNRPEAVRDFAAAQTADGGQIVVKPLSSASIAEDGLRKPIWTHPLTDDDLADLTGVSTTAHLFQRYIAPKAFEARVTVVGGRMFAAAIHADSDAARVDWRCDYDAQQLSIVAVPEPVAAGIMQFMTRMRLVFGAFDFAVDQTGDWWYLETNSAGLYGWIEDATGLPITTTLADLLEKGHP